LRLKDFLEEVKGLPPETLLDGVGWIVYKSPGYYDGYPTEITGDYNMTIVNEPKLRIHKTNYEELMWESFERDLSKEENFRECINRFNISPAIPTNKFEDCLKGFCKEFEKHYSEFIGDE